MKVIYCLLAALTIWLGAGEANAQTNYPDKPIRIIVGFSAGVAPAGMPQPILDKLYQETAKVLAQPDVRSKLESLGLQLVGNSPAEFAAIIKTETPAWGKVIKDAGIKMNE